MQTQVASLLMITATVVLASIVVCFAVSISEQTLSIDDNPQIERIQNLQDQMLNQTSSWLDGLQNYNFNQTLPPAEP